MGRTMNRLQSSAKKNDGEVLTEDFLWAKGLLGDETPKMLLDTVVYTAESIRAAMLMIFTVV